MDSNQSSQNFTDWEMACTDSAKSGGDALEGLAPPEGVAQTSSVACLIHEESGSRYNLVTRNVIGRSRSANLWLDRPYMSHEHATLSWNGISWELKDLCSRNGTIVDGRRLDAGETVVLAKGMKLGFGDPSDKWILADVTAPVLSAVDVETGEVIIAEGDLLSLPQNESPELSIYQQKDGQWVVESATCELSELTDCSVVAVGGKTYRVHLPQIDEGTPLLGLPDLDTMKARFEVSKDLEHVRVILSHAGGELELEPREHSFLLLVLAKERLAEQDVASPESGWVDRDELAKMVGVTVPVLHVLVHRARQQFADHNIPGAASIIDVRRGQRRIGLGALEIIEY